MTRWMAALTAVAMLGLTPVANVRAAKDEAASDAIATAAEAQGQEKPEPGTAPICFAEEGEPDYEYADEGIAVAIKRFDEKGVVFFVCDVQIADASQISTALSGDQPGGKKEKTGDIAARNEAVLAVNGDDYGVHKYGTIIRNGELIRARETTRHMMTIDANGDLGLVTDRSEDPEALAQRLLDSGVTQAFEFGPALVEEGEAFAFKESGYKLIKTQNSIREPRTGVGQVGPLHYVVIVVDGRREGYSKGISIQGLQELFLRFHAQTAFNLDGGGSTTLYFNGEILNRPAQNAQRKVTDILMFK